MGVDRERGAGHRAWWPALVVAGVALALWRSASPTPASETEARASAAADTGSRPDAHGRDAATPADIPPRGWLDIAKRLVTEIGDDRVLAVAAGVTFYALLALFPAVTAFVSLYGLFAEPATIAKQIDNLQGILPEGGLSIIGEQVRSITAKPASSLGIATVVGLLVALWSANAGMKAVFDALNVVYKEKEKRSFIRLNAISLAFTVGAFAILILAMVAVVVVPIVLQFVGLGGFGVTLLALLRWPILLVGIALGFAVLYRFGPSRDAAQWRWLSPGSALAAIGWIVASAGFSFYVGHFGSYNATYGSLGAAIGFMTWIWISSIVVLVGAELNAESEHQTEKDTTQGPEQPAGSRGARMADEVAAT